MLGSLIFTAKPAIDVVILMTDDTGWNDFGASSGGGAALGHPTPNIDRITKEGALFTNWYGQANCTAGRSSFITGRTNKCGSRLTEVEPICGLLLADSAHLVKVAFGAE